MNESNYLPWAIAAILGFTLYQTRETVKEFEALTNHNLSRMQYVESNLLATKVKLANIRTDYANNFINKPDREIEDALVDVRAEIEDLRKFLDKKR